MERPNVAVEAKFAAGNIVRSHAGGPDMYVMYSYVDDLQILKYACKYFSGDSFKVTECRESELRLIRAVGTC